MTKDLLAKSPRGGIEERLGLRLEWSQKARFVKQVDEAMYGRGNLMYSLEKIAPDSVFPLEALSNIRLCLNRLFAGSSERKINFVS